MSWIISHAISAVKSETPHLMGCIVSERDTRRAEKRRRAWVVSRKHFALSGTLADRVISLAHILGRPVRNAAGTRIGRVSDIVVRWDADNEHPPVTGVLVKCAQRSCGRTTRRT